MAGPATLGNPRYRHALRAACVGRVQHAIEGEGVSSAAVNLMTNTATVAYDPAIVTADTLVDRIKSTGYGASLPVGTQSDAERQEEQDRIRRDEYADYRRKGAEISLAIGIAVMAVPMFIPANAAMPLLLWPWTPTRHHDWCDALGGPGISTHAHGPPFATVRPT